jgi:lipid-A-disaccharide synthase
MKIFFSVGEPSGDLHGANLIRALRARRPELECVGYGGPLMAAAGCRLHADLTALAVMWILRVLANLHKFLHLASLADRYFRHQRPDAVVLIDYPGFNWWIARRAKAHGIPVFYYAPPQIWAWASWRVKKMRRFVDHVLCALPFEQEWFSRRGCHAVFVGHPYFDEVRYHPLDADFVERMRSGRGPLVTILPGSRTQEVEQNLDTFLQAARRIRERVPDARFAVAAFKPRQAEYARGRVAAAGLDIPVYVRRTPELIASAECCIAVSGSVSLELLYHGKPTVIHYRISRFAYLVQGFFRRAAYITLVNLLNAREIFPEKVVPYDPSLPGAERVLFPEYLTCEDRAPAIADHVVGWLLDPLALQSRVEELTALRARVAHGGASTKAADYILRQLDAQRRPVLRPHYQPGMRIASSGLGQ